MLSCVEYLMFQKVAFTLGESILSANANEKMSNSQKRCDRNLALIRTDMAARSLFTNGCRMVDVR